jgi:hypothetical protein
VLPLPPPKALPNVHATAPLAVEDVIGQDELVLAHRTHLSVEEVRALQRSLRLAYAASPMPATLLLRQAHAHRHPLSVGLTAYPCLYPSPFSFGQP